MSKNFERWKELATLTSKEQDPAKLTELATEMNLVLNQKPPHLDPPLHAPSSGSHEESQLVLKASPFFMVGEEKPEADSCVQKESMWLFDPATQKLVSLLEDYKVQRYGKFESRSVE